MNTLIIGSGFGSYGYLPAVYNLSESIYLDLRYKNKIENRIELKKYLKKVVWYKEIKTVFKKIDYLIIAQNPKNQDFILRRLIGIYKPRHVLLEKPISNNPSNAIKLIKFLEKKRIQFSVGFLFKYLKWFKYLKKKSSKQHFKIIWNIKINNKNNSWKYLHSAGGGLIRFYSIHFIIIFFNFKFLKIKKIIKKKKYFYLNVSDFSKNNIELEVKYAKYNLFVVKHNNIQYFKSSNPFLKPIIKKKDPRVSILKTYLNDIVKNFKLNYVYEKKFIYYWNKIEKKNG